MDYVSLGSLTEAYEEKQQEKIEGLKEQGDQLVALNHQCSKTLSALTNLREQKQLKSVSFEELEHSDEYKQWEASVWKLRQHDNVGDTHLTENLIEIHNGKERIAPLTDARLQDFVQNVQSTLATYLGPQSSFFLNKVSMETTQFNMILSVLSYMGRMVHQLHSSIQRKTSSGR